MATLVSTGQITIADQNDSRSIAISLATNVGNTQVYTFQDTETSSYAPNFNASPYLVVTPMLSIGGLSSAEGWGGVTNRTFSLTSDGAALTNASANPSSTFVTNAGVVLATGNVFILANTTDNSATVPTLTIKGNISSSVKVVTIYFSGDYTDSYTGLTTAITSQIVINVISTGTNATFVLIKGNLAIQEASGQTKNTVAIKAELYRGSVLDTSSLQYKWYTNNGSTQVVSGNVNFKGTITATDTMPTQNIPTDGTGLPAAGAWGTNNTLNIHEAAVVDMAIFKVLINDTNTNTQFSQTFTVVDWSDPYDTYISSTNGDRLLNGIGSTILVPIVNNGATKVPDLTGWTFNWYIWDKIGKRTAFVNTALFNDGRSITANTTGVAATITYTGTTNTLVAGQLIKVVKPNGDTRIYEVVASTATVITIRTPTAANSWLTFTDYPAPTAANEFLGGIVYAALAVKTTAGANGLAVTGQDIDGKGTITVESSKP